MFYELVALEKSSDLSKKCFYLAKKNTQFVSEKSQI